MRRNDLSYAHELTSTTYLFPLIKFVPEGYPGGNLNTHNPQTDDSGTLLKLSPCDPISIFECKFLYNKGLNVLLNMGWKMGDFLGCSRTGLREPLNFVRYSGSVDLVALSYQPMSINQIAQPLLILALAPQDNLEQKSFRLLPQIMITCGEVELAALIDSGSEVTCINEEYYNKLKGTRVFPILPVASTHLRGAMGQLSTRVRFQVWLEFHITAVPQSLNHTFLVVKNLVRPIILGIDWLCKVNAQIDFAQNSMAISLGSDYFSIPFNINARCLIYDSTTSFDRPTNSSINHINNASHESPTLSDTHPPNLSLTSHVNSVDELANKLLEINTVSSQQKQQLLKLLLKYRSVFNKYPGRTALYFHEIKMHDKTPFVKRPYPIPFSFRSEVETTIQNMLELGVIKREASPYASPLAVAKKKDGSVRVCLDARLINSRMVADHEAPTPPEEIFNSFTSIKYMTTIDLRSSYWQIPLTPDSTKYTAFLYNGKTYTFQVLPFGLKTAVGSFTRAMDVILGPEVQDFTYKYIDDLLVVSNSFEAHLEHLEIIFAKLMRANMTINLDKTEFVKQEVKFLGHILTTRGVLPDPDKTRAIRNFPVPRTVKQLRAFLGLCNYYRRFSKQYSAVTAGLTRLLRKDQKWKWGSFEQEVFEQVKELFLNSVMLRFPNFKKTFYLQTDSSGVAMGVELYQIDDEKEHLVLGFASKILRGPELLYTVTEKELFAIIFGLKKFRSLILGHQLVIRTDHYALKFLKQCRLLNDRLTRWMMYLNEFDFVVEHVRGQDNIVADTLSRYPPELGDTTLLSDKHPIVVPIMHEYLVNLFEVDTLEELKVLFRDLRVYQLNDAFLGPIFDYLVGHGTVLNQCQARLVSQFQIHQDILICYNPFQNSPKLAVPDKMVKILVESYHKHFGHFGISKLFNIMRINLFFPNMRRRIQQFVRSCDLCQKSKFPSRNLIGTTHPILTYNPGDLVTVDYYGPLPEGRSKCSYIFVVIDAFSKFVKLYPLRRAQAKISALKIVNDFHKIIPIKVILSDHGTQFQSKFWQETMRRYNIRPTFSSIRHPESNPTERVMKELSRLFRTYCSRSHCGWVSQLKNIEELFNSAPHLSTGYSPNEVLHGTNPTNQLNRLILPFLPSPTTTKSVRVIREEVRHRMDARAREYSSKLLKDKLMVNDLVLLRESPISDAVNKVIYKFCPLFSGPYKISGNPYPNVYTLCDPVSNVKKGNYNITNLKFYYRAELESD